MDFLKKHSRKIITCCIGFISCLIIFMPFLLTVIFPEFKCDNKFNYAVGISQILSAIFVIVGSVIAVWQYYISSRGQIIQMEKDRIEKAISLSEFYKDNVLSKYSLIKHAYKVSGLCDVLESKKKQMEDFDCEEMYEIFTQDELKQIKQCINSEDFVKAIVQYNEATESNLKGIIVTVCDEEGKQCKTISVNQPALVSGFMLDYVSNVLNDLEVFAMYFTHNVADETVIYQSVYPSYIEMCRVLYWNISKCSEQGKAKLYRNIQQLYSDWSKREQETKNNIKEKECNSGTVAKNLI